MKLTVSLSEKSNFELEGGGVTSYVSWKRLTPYLQNAIGLNQGERILGTIVDDNGINVRTDFTDEMKEHLKTIKV